MQGASKFSGDVNAAARADISDPEPAVDQVPAPPGKRPIATFVIYALAAILFAAVCVLCVSANAQDQQLLPPPEGQQNDAEMWRAVRGGVEGTVSIPDPQARVLVQPGEGWRSLRNGPVSTYGVWLLLGMVAVLAAFFAIRGRIRIEGGRSGTPILRFALFERLVHWVTAISFIILALTGLNILYGRYFLKDWLGGEAFASLTMAGKYAHNYVGLVFIAGIALMLLMWIRHNIPNRHDLVWLAKGGGFFSKGSHPPARKFNAGQKIVFAAVIIVGGLLSYSGLLLMFPFTGGATIEDMQAIQVLHAVGALALTALIIAHIYIGSIGMEGGFEAMWSGTVDKNWAREHHSLWVAEMETADEPKPAPDPAPAE